MLSNLKKTVLLCTMSAAVHTSELPPSSHQATAIASSIMYIFKKEIKNKEFPPLHLLHPDLPLDHIHSALTKCAHNAESLHDIKNLFTTLQKIPIDPTKKTRFEKRHRYINRQIIAQEENNEQLFQILLQRLDSENIKTLREEVKTLCLDLQNEPLTARILSIASLAKHKARIQHP